MTDNNGVKLTVQEALSNEDVSRNMILPWRVIDRLNLPGGYTRRSAGVGIGETAGFQVTSGRSVIEADALAQCA